MVGLSGDMLHDVLLAICLIDFPKSFLGAKQNSKQIV